MFESLLDELEIKLINATAAIKEELQREVDSNQRFKKINIIKDDKNSTEFLDDIKIEYMNEEFKLVSTKKTINLLHAADIGRANPKLGEIQPTAWKDKLVDHIEKKAFNF